MSQVDRNRQRIKEARDTWNKLSKRIAAVRGDIAIELDSERKVILQERLLDLENQRDTVAKELDEREGKLGVDEDLVEDDKVSNLETMVTQLQQALQTLQDKLKINNLDNTSTDSEALNDTLIDKNAKDNTTTLKFNFNLKFTNRLVEKEFIQTLLPTKQNIQIYAPAGLGKTYLLRQIEQEMAADGWRTIWLDFSQDTPLRANRHLFLAEFARQLWGKDSPPISQHQDGKALHLIGQKLVNIEKVVVFLDDADEGDIRLLQWIRATFLEKLSEWSPLRMIAAAQQIIAEWKGHRSGRPFRQLPLSGFEDPLIIEEIITDIVARFGAKPIQRKQEEGGEAWQTYLNAMIRGLFQVTRGHPLAMERVLRYVAKEDGLMHPTFFSEQWNNLCDRCLAPMVGERILLTVDRSVREAFRSLCVFRYVWPALFTQLITTKVAEELGGPWEPFGTTSKTWRYWWLDLQETNLIHNPDTRQLYQVSPIIRQLIALVLQTENPDCYKARNKRAKEAYQTLLKSSDVPIAQRGSALLEIFYHTTQEENIESDNISNYFKQQLNNFLQPLSNNETELFNIKSQLLSWLSQDKELRNALNNFAGFELDMELINLVNNYN